MNLFYRRNLALFCALFAAASLCGCLLNAPNKWRVGLLVLTVAVILAPLLFLKRFRARVLKAILCLVFVALALIQAYLVIDRERQKLEPLIGMTVEADITIVEVNSISDFFSSYRAIATLEGQSHDAVFLCEYAGDFSVGDVIHGQVLVDDIGTHYEETSYYLARGVYIALVSTEDSLEVIDTGYINLEIRMRALNSRWSKILERELGGSAADLSSAISLGNKDLLSDEIVRDFRRTGLSHVLAISGMHLSVIMLALEAVLRHFGFRKEGRCIAIFSFALFYLALTGFSLSTVRAFIMVSLVYLAFLVRNDNDTVTSLFFALFLILLISPNSVWDIGLWLSFLAVLGLIVSDYFTKRLTEQLYRTNLNKKAVKVLISLLSAIIVTLAANIFVCLPLWLFFGELSLISVLANLIVSPLVTVILFLAPLLLLIQFVPLLIYLSPVLAHLLCFICDIAIRLVSTLSDWENIVISLRYPFAGLIIVPASLLLFILVIVPLRRKLWIPLVPAVAALAFCGCLLTYNLTNSDKLTVDYLHYNESEALLLTSVEGSTIIDLSTGANSYLYATAALAKEKCSTEISSLVLTHYHTLHISTFSRNAARFMIRTLYLPYPQTVDEYYLMRALIRNAQKSGTDVIIYDPEKDFSPIENVTVNVSKRFYLKRSTHPTFSLSVSAYGNTMTYVAESAHEDTCLLESTEERIEKSDYVVFGLHGPISKKTFSYESLSPEQYVFISSPDVLSHFKPTPELKVITESTMVTFRFQTPKTA